MDELKNLFDPYDRKARLYPALLALLPIFPTIAVWTPILYKVGVSFIGLVVACGVLYVFAQFARSEGRRLENRLWEDWGGPPTTLWLRQSGEYLNEITRLRYLQFFLKNIDNWVAPTPEEEQADQNKADQIYGSAVDWLLKYTRDKNKYSLLFKENINYGFRRNSLGLKPFAIIVAVTSFWISAIFLFGTSATVLFDEKLPQIAVFIISCGLLAWWVFVVNQAWVRHAADTYAKSLLESCDQ